MLLEFELRASIILLSALLSTMTAIVSACDRQTPDAEQAQDATGAGFAEETDTKTSLSGTLDISKRGNPMPDVSFLAPDGTAVRLDDFRGKPILVNLWATWCAPCVVEMPTLDRLAGREIERLQVMVVSQDLQGDDVVAPFFAESNFQYLEPYIDPENELGFSYESGVMPTTVLYDSHGREVWRMIGGMEWDGARAAALLEETLNSPAG